MTLGLVVVDEAHEAAMDLVGPCPDRAAAEHPVLGSGLGEVGQELVKVLLVLATDGTCVGA
jgi:hypothetical protein